MVTKAELDKALEGTKAEFDKALDGIRVQFDDLHTTTNRKLDEYSVRQERQFADFLDQAQSSDAQTQSLLVQAVIQQLQISQDRFAASFRTEMNTRLAELDSKITQGHVRSSSGKSLPPHENTMSTFRRPPLDSSDLHGDDSDGFRRESRFQFPRADCPSFTGTKPVEWVRKYNSFFALHQVPDNYKTHLATLQFFDSANDWYDGYLMDHDPPDWPTLVRLVQKRFQRGIANTGLDDLKTLTQSGTVHEYLQHFEQLKSKLLLEGRHFTEIDFVDIFIGGLKGEIKPFVKIFKPTTLEEVYEYASYLEQATDSQLRRLRYSTKPIISPQQITTPEKNSLPPPKSVLIHPSKPSLIEQRRALGQCFKCGEKYFPGHQCKFKIQMLVGQHTEQEEDGVPAEMNNNPPEEEQQVTEEVIVSMHATSNNPCSNTMRFKGQIGTFPIFALIDSGSTHSFVNPTVLKDHTSHIMATNPMVVMVANGERMVTDSKCQALLFSIQGHQFCHDLRLLPVQGYDVILGLDWLSQFSPMYIDWYNRWVEFHQHGERIRL
jgi:Retroviral aspartyl protease/Ty3 transposon capsid-like protein